ncbi:PD-(D/E)XK nuclease family protein [Desulfatirhabdium butyrativorans]|uniref:PD-(D/E)XK nuclease family protein n=1 Tax=Desulfatirhabdium butyrativorans TaxID=340467 RepID=UPI0003FB8665|nr:DUF3782 domain-containing protein [Desulfatirhabdium butyrativorans]
MNAEAIKEIIRKELPTLLRDDPELRAFLSDLMRRDFTSRAETQDRFYEILDELRRDREEQKKKWEAQQKKWDEQEKERKEQQKKWDEQQNRWDEQQKRWEEQKEHWRINHEQFNMVHQEIMAQARKFDRSIGALGARWGLRSEKAFRDALAGILEESFHVQVLNINEWDEDGMVFGRPDQVEIDVIIKNGLLIICELKSSIDKAGMVIFERKARFYEKRHNQKANRLIVISPMIDPKALTVAKTLGIETYGDSTEVESL